MDVERRSSKFKSSGTCSYRKLPTLVELSEIDEEMLVQSHECTYLRASTSLGKCRDNHLPQAVGDYYRAG